MSRRAFVIAAMIASMAVPVLAGDYIVGALRITHPWARATPKGASVGGGYLAITNTGSTPDRLIGGASDVAEHVELHQMRMDNGVMKMRSLAKGLAIKPGETITLAPGGYHVMFVGLRSPLIEGEHVKVMLKFEKAGAVNVEFDIGLIAAQGPDSGGHVMRPGMMDQKMK